MLPPFPSSACVSLPPPSHHRRCSGPTGAASARRPCWACLGCRALRCSETWQQTPAPCWPGGTDVSRGRGAAGLGWLLLLGRGAAGGGCSPSRVSWVRHRCPAQVPPHPPPHPPANVRASGLLVSFRGTASKQNAITDVKVTLRACRRRCPMAAAPARAARPAATAPIVPSDQFATYSACTHLRYTTSPPCRPGKRRWSRGRVAWGHRLECTPASCTPTEPMPCGRRCATASWS